MKHRAVFQKRGPLALDASAWGMEIAIDIFAPNAFTIENDVAIVRVDGPLVFTPDWLWQSYGAFLARVKAAFESEAKAVLLDIHSPGGDVAGLFDTARALKLLASAYPTKRFAALSNAMATSAAFALACAAPKIYVTDTSVVGSIGCIDTLVDETARDRAQGLRVEVISSGERKLDRNAHVPISDDARAEVRAQVEQLADIFFGWVQQTRGVDPAVAKSMNGALFIGKDAVAAGLADEVVTRESLLAMLASDEAATAAATKGSKMNLKEMRAALQKMMEDGTDEEKAKAKKMLAAIDDEGEKKEATSDDEEKKKEAAAEEEKKQAAARAAEEEEKKKAAAEDDEAKAMAGKALARVGALETELAAERAKNEAQAIEELLKPRMAANGGDLTDEQLKLIRESKTLAGVQKMLAILPPPPKKNPAAAAMGAQPTIGDGRGSGQQAFAPETQVGVDGKGQPITAGHVDERMGLTKKDVGPRWEGRDRVFPMASDRASEKRVAKALLDQQTKGGAR